jgi:predicted transcriptional regulator
MCAEYQLGGKPNTIQKIAKKFGRDKNTVSKIVKSEEQQERARKIGELFFRNTAEAAARRVYQEVTDVNSDHGAQIAMQLLERWNIIPPQVTREHILRERMQPAQQLPENERVRNIVMRLTEIAMERGEVYGMDLPELEALKDGKEEAVMISR